MQTNDINDIFETLLNDSYNAEKQMKEFFPELAKATTNPEMSAKFQQGAKESEAQMERLEKLYDMMDIDKKDHICEAMEGLVEEAKTMMKGAEEGPVRDAGLIAYALKMNHYEIASYTALIGLAEAMGYNDAANQMKMNQKEEKDAAQAFESLAKTSVNPDAMRQAA